MSVALYDAPLPASGDVHVNVAVVGVDAVANGSLAPLATYANPQIVDLLTLKHVAFTIEGSLPPGSYDAIRLLIDPSRSSVTANGRTYPMIFGTRGKNVSPAVVGIDAKTQISGASGDQVNVAIDFNVLESIALRGNVAYVQPKLVIAKHPARIDGHVANAAGAPVKNATVVAYDAAGNVANTTITEEDGAFTLHALAAGTYRVAVLNTYVTAAGEIVTASGATGLTGPSVDATVAPGDVLDLGTLGD